MKKTLLPLILVLSVFTLIGCSKDESKTKDATITKFIAAKCNCCWGWEIEYDGKTIKADKLPDQESIGYDIESPIEAEIEVGEMTEDCPEYDYYEIKTLKIK